jgi:hypothetical protein
VLRGFALEKVQVIESRENFRDESIGPAFLGLVAYTIEEALATGEDL